MISSVSGVLIRRSLVFSITVSSINELNSFNVERVISIKGELDSQMRALEIIYSKLCSASENDNARVWNYSSPQYHLQQQQQQQLMQHFAQQTLMAATASGGPPLLPTHYNQQQQQQQQQQPAVIQHAPIASTNGSSSKYAEHQSQPTAMYHQSYYVSRTVSSKRRRTSVPFQPPMFPVPGPFYMSYPPAGHLPSSHAHHYGNVAANGNGNFAHQQQQQQQPPLPPSMGSSSQNSPAVIETVHLYVPNTVIGAIIGTKGLFIKSIIKSSNASVKVDSRSAPFDSIRMISVRS